MAGPNVNSNYFTEREGVLSVARLVNEIHCVWRETPNADVGVDGQIEFVNQVGEATGHIVAVQVKAGKSYMKVSGEVIRFYPESKHRVYWENFPLPVMVVVYDPDAHLAYWTDARRFLRSDQGMASEFIPIPIEQTLDLPHRDGLFETCGAFDLPVLPIQNVLDTMLRAENPNAGFPVSYFALFVNGLISISRKLFFSMRLCSEIAEWRHNHMDSEFGMGLGSSDYDFLDAYIRFLVAQNLVVFDFSDYLIDWNEREITPVFACALTSRGRELVEYIHLEEERRGIWEGVDQRERFSIASERLVGTVYTPYEERRFIQIERFKMAASTTNKTGKRDS